MAPREIGSVKSRLWVLRAPFYFLKSRDVGGTVVDVTHERAELPRHDRPGVSSLSRPSNVPESPRASPARQDRKPPARAPREASGSAHCRASWSLRRRRPRAPRRSHEPLSEQLAGRPSAQVPRGAQLQHPRRHEQRDEPHARHGHPRRPPRRVAAVAGPEPTPRDAQPARAPRTHLRVPDDDVPGHDHVHPRLPDPRGGAVRVQHGP